MNAVNCRGRRTTCPGGRCRGPPRRSTPQLLRAALVRILDDLSLRRTLRPSKENIVILKVFIKHQTQPVACIIMCNKFKIVKVKHNKDELYFKRRLYLKANQQVYLPYIFLLINKQDCQFEYLYNRDKQKKTQNLPVKRQQRV